MFDIDKWQEIFATLRKNRLRSFLTGFSVAWGIFMLMVLLGSGTGLENGVKSEFSGDAVNSLWVNSGRTSLAYDGLQPNRDIHFTYDDRTLVAQNHSDAKNLSARLNLWMLNQFTYKKKNGKFNVRGVERGMMASEKIVIKRGRFIHEEDVKQSKKVAAVGQMLVDELVGKEDPIGQYIEIEGIPFLIVGIFTDEGGENDMRRAYIPITSGQKIFTGKEEVDQIVLTLDDMEKSKQTEKEIRTLLAGRHHFDPKDDKAIFIWNNLTEYNRIIGVITGIRIFVWIIGIGTLIAGIVGISNIMMIAVKERTKEIGIRKALGATPLSIVSLVIQESVFITAVSGYVGMILGILTLESAKSWLPPSDFFKDPTVDLQIAVYANLLLIVAGILAGFFPARKAAAVRPIEALRDE